MTSNTAPSVLLALAPDASRLMLGDAAPITSLEASACWVTRAQGAHQDSLGIGS